MTWVSFGERWNACLLGFVKRDTRQQILGVAFVNDSKHAEYAHIDFLFVHPQYRRRGVGTALMRTILGWGRSHYGLIADKDDSEAFFKTFGFTDDRGSMPPSLSHLPMPWAIFLAQNA